MPTVAEVADRTAADLPSSERLQGPLPAFVLIDQGRLGRICQWPNRDESKPLHLSWAYMRGLSPATRWGNELIRMRSPRGERWKDLSTGSVRFFGANGYFDIVRALKSYDAEKQNLQIENPPWDFIAGGRAYYAMNLREELDQPGEWFFHPKQRTISYFTKDGKRPTGIEVSQTKNLVLVNGTRHVAWEGFVFEGANGTAVKVKDGSHLSILGSVVRNCLGNGIEMVGGTNYRVQSCDLHDLGGGGIRMISGDRRTLTPSRSVITNNSVHDWANLQLTYQFGIAVDGVGIVVSNNLLYRSPHIPIHCQGVDMVVEKNRIFNVCRESGDCSAYYLWADVATQNIIVRENLIHDLGGWDIVSTNDAAPESDFKNVPVQHFDAGAWWRLRRGADENGTVIYRNTVANGIYLDDAISDHTIERNVLVRAGWLGVFIHGGQRNRVINNIIQGEGPLMDVAPHQKGAEEIEKNWLQGFDRTKPPYSTRFPWLNRPVSEMLPMRDNEFSRNVLVSPGTTFWGDGYFNPDRDRSHRNLFVVAPERAKFRVGARNEGRDITGSLAEVQRLGLEVGSQFATPQRVVGNDFQITLPPSAAALGIVSVDTRKIGLFRDRFRPTLPKVEFEIWRPIEFRLTGKAD